jgi:hypothetical protein
LGKHKGDPKQHWGDGGGAKQQREKLGDAQFFFQKQQWACWGHVEEDIKGCQVALGELQGMSGRVGKNLGHYEKFRCGKMLGKCQTSLENDMGCSRTWKT